MATEFMSSTSSSSYLVDYLSTDPTNDLPAIDNLTHHHHQDPFTSPMSPVQSAASTPPLSNQNNQNLHQSHNNNTMSSYATPVPLSSAPYSMPIQAFPRRAEHSYAQNNYLPHPYTMGVPPPPPGVNQRQRGPQLPSASLLQPQQSTYVPDVPSSAPDAPPSGSGGSRKRPKYTRSKKGCLTCRSKKIKCDERKPLCTRCEHGHRECTWPETVLPRRPKGAVRGVGNEDDEEEDIDERRGSIPGSAVSSHFPSSTTSTHFPGLGNNSPFETAPPRRDAFESDGTYSNGSQFPLPLANTRPFFPRSGAPSADFYPVTTVNGQPIDEYEFPPRQSFPGSSSGSAANPTSTGGGARAYSNGSLYATGPPGSVPSYNGDMRRASWDSSAPTDGRRPSWDNNSLAVSSASSPAGSALGLGLGAVGGGIGRGAATGVASGSSNGVPGAGGSGSGAPGVGGGLMLFQSPDPLSPFFRSVQERNLVGYISSFTPSSTPPFSSSPYSSSPYTPSPYTPSSSSSASTLPRTSSSDTLSSFGGAMEPAGHYLSASPVLSSASSQEFGLTAEGMAYRKNSYPHLYPPPRPLTLDPPAPLAAVAPGSGGGADFTSSPTDLAEGKNNSRSRMGTGDVDWLAPPVPIMNYRPSYSMEGEEYVSWDAYS